MARAHKNERCPASEPDTLCERETACAVAGKRGSRLRIEQSREHDPSVRRNKPRDRGGELLERIE